MLTFRQDNRSLFSHLYNLSRDLDGAFGTRWDTERLSTWTPSVEVQETEDSIRMTVELPGVSPKDVNLMSQHGVLTINGQKAPVVKQENTAVRYSERWYGEFERTFALPASAQADKIEASFENGILTIQIQKTEQSKARRVPIAVNGADAGVKLGAGPK